MPYDFDEIDEVNLIGETQDFEQRKLEEIEDEGKKEREKKEERNKK